MVQLGMEDCGMCKMFTADSLSQIRSSTFPKPPIAGSAQDCLFLNSDLVCTEVRGPELLGDMVSLALLF